MVLVTILQMIIVDLWFLEEYFEYGLIASVLDYDDFIGFSLEYWI